MTSNSSSQHNPEDHDLNFRRENVKSLITA